MSASIDDSYGPPCTCKLLTAATHLEPAAWEQDTNCPKHFAFPICLLCANSTTYRGRLWVKDNVVQGRLCDEHSIEAADRMAEARDDEAGRCN